jgi:UDP-N-acetyl-D-glucosamine dehydrogenase
MSINNSDWAMLIQEKISNRSARVAVIGLGYVGLPFALEAAQAGFKVTGIDRDTHRVAQVNKGQSYLLDIESSRLEQVVREQRLTATDQFRYLGEADVVVICVPTPLNNRKDPDISFIEDAVNEICKYDRKGRMISLESTTYPGTTEEIIASRMRCLGLEPGKDVFIAFAPERLDPGNSQYGTANTPKVVGGVTEKCREVAACFYRQVISEVKTVSSPGVAEMTKLLENTYRAVNISLINELMMLCDHMGIDIWEVVEAAATKPFGMQTFYPGPGIGGHCISVDPFYLAWKAKEYGYHVGFIEWAGRINNQVTQYVVNKVAEALNNRGRCLKGSRILVVGVTYKKDVADTRESPALVIIEKLLKLKADVRYYDPFISHIILPDRVSLKTVELSEDEVAGADCLLIITDHSAIDYQWLVEKAPVVIDTRNAAGDVKKGREKIILI